MGHRPKSLPLASIALFDNLKQVGRSKDMHAHGERLCALVHAYLMVEGMAS